MIKTGIFIGIDPDCIKSGVAIYIRQPRELIIACYRFWELFDLLSKHKSTVEKVFIEAGWLNEKSNWHTHGKGEGVASRVGKNVGANHQTGKLIAQMCEYLKIEYELRKPSSSKVYDLLFKKITGYEGRTNQEERDAAMLIFGI